MNNENSDEKEITEKDERLIMIHGFSKEETLKIMRTVKSVIDNPKGAAFTMTTETNINWKIADLIKEVRAEHEYLQKNPPQGKPKDDDFKQF